MEPPDGVYRRQELAHTLLVTVLATPLLELVLGHLLAALLL